MYENQNFYNSLFNGIVTSQQTDNTVFEIAVSNFNQLAMINGLVDESDTVVMYVDVTEVHDIDGVVDDHVKRHLHDFLIRATLVGDFPWNSIVFKNPPELVNPPPAVVSQEVVPVIAQRPGLNTARANVGELQQRYSGRRIVDRSVQYIDN